MSQEKVKPIKKVDKVLWALVEEKIGCGDYLFLPHAKRRQRDRFISDIDVLDILENKANRKRRHNKKKDSYTEGFADWNYCIEGFDLDGKIIRIIISFEEESDLLIVTVIRLDSMR